MMKLAEKLGLEKEAEYRKARIVDGKYYDSISYGILKEDWERRSKAKSITIENLRLETDRLIIRAYKKEDATGLYETLNDKKVLDYIPEEPINMEQAHAAIEWLMSNYKLDLDSNYKYSFAIELKKTGTYIGWCGFGYLDYDDRQREIYYTLKSEYWGNGYATEATTALVRYILEEMKLEKIVAVVKPDNRASQKVIEKLGFKKTGVIQNLPKAYEFYNGEIHYILENKNEALKDIKITVDDLMDEKVIQLVTEHKSTMLSITPEESCHALNLDDLRCSDITFWTIWSGTTLLGCGALKALEGACGELKSMRTQKQYLRLGVAERMLSHIIKEAQARGYSKIFLETGSSEPFFPAHRLYKKYGFTECGPFADYTEDPNSCFMSLDLFYPMNR